MANREKNTMEKSKINPSNNIMKRVLTELRIAGYINRKLKQALCVMMIFTLLAVSTPAAPQIVTQSILKFKQNTFLFFELNGWLSFSSWTAPEAPNQETQEERDGKVVKIEIDSDGQSFTAGRKIQLFAIPYDINNNPVSGVKFEWEVENSEGVQQEVKDEIFTTTTLGDYKITARGASNESIAKFTVINAADEPYPKQVAESAVQVPLINYNEWDVANISHARRIKNIRGEAPGISKGKTNFNIVAPVLSVPGRGLNLDLNLNYNSLVWSKLDNDISYDMDKDWLSPGWTIGFGKIVNIINGGIVQVDNDGTRRFYAGTITGANDKVTYEGQSTDGSFIKSFTQTSVTPNGQCFYGPTTYLKYPDGSTIWYDDWENKDCYTISDPITMVPRRIQDRHGNQITITYHTPGNGIPTGRWINQVKDSVGRFYTFNYTLDNGKYYLTTVTAPGLPDTNGNAVSRTFVRLQYKNQTISHNFSGLTAHVRESNIKVLSAIYYPATQSGYWFGDDDSPSEGNSYSPYGMIRRVDERRAMTYSAETGITKGMLSRRRIYSYPQNITTPITDTPSFSTVTETWEGMTTAAPVTQYEVNWDATPRTTTTIALNQSGGIQSKIVEYANNFSTLLDTDQEKIKDGLNFKTEYYDSANQLRNKSEVEWELGVKANTCPNPANSCVEVKIPRAKKITQSEFENGQTFSKITNNNYGENGEYNRVLEVTETGYGGTTDVLRKTVSTYTKKGDSPSGDDGWRALPRLINLPTVIEVFDNNNNRIAYTKYDYDLNTMQPFSGAIPTNFCADSYCSSITDRGNLSKTTVYANITNSSLNGEFANNIVYDRAGNIVEQKPEITADTIKSYKFTSDTRYAYPEEKKIGTNNPNLPEIAVKKISTYNLNTGLALTVTDVDQQTVELKYDINDWRLKKTLFPTGGSTDFEYDDVNKTYAQYSSTATNILAGKQISKLNGLGLPYRKESYVKTVIVNGANQDVWDVVETEYDEFGRTKKTSTPFRSNDSEHGTYWSEVFYDSIGRAWKTASPDGSTKFTYYNEVTRPQYASANPGKTSRVKDPIGREKWERIDSDGNLVEVVEPNPDGTGEVATNGLITKYNYDKLKRLLQTEQGQQIRKFKYDSLGRMTHQKMAETQSTLDSDGNFVGTTNGTWSDFYTYDKHSNIISYKDARGVSTNYVYADLSQSTYLTDPLNRLFTISYNTNGATDVLPSPTVNFTYRTSENTSQVKTVTTGGVNTIEFEYDSRGRINQKKNTILNRANYPTTVNYSYDSLNRVTDITYPDQYGTGSTRKVVHTDFDASGRTNALKVDGANYASDFVFNNFSQVTSVKIGPSGANQINEIYNYNLQTGLLENQKVLRGTTSLLDLTYEYQQCSCSTGGSGQIKKITNNLDRNKDRSYEYDALARLKNVTGGINTGWTQTYVYDRYGNRTNVNSLGLENRSATNNAESNQDTTGEQKKILAGALPIAVPNVKELISNAGQLPDIEKGAKAINNTTPDIEKSLNTSPSNKRQSEKEGKVTNSESGNNTDLSITSPPTRKPFDFDGDGKADYSAFQRGNGNWAINKSGTNQTTNTSFGASTDQIAPADYDGDGKTDIAVFRPSTGSWYILKSSDSTYYGVQWGQMGDAITPGDYDGDGKADVAVWRPSNSYWYILRSSDGNWTQTLFGGQQYGDIPVVGDYDGDGKADIAVWRPTGSGFWYILQSSNGQVASPQLGTNGYIPVPADYDGDGKTDIAVWSVTNGYWYITRSSDNQTIYFPFGGRQFGDILVPADYDGDGKADVAVWRSSSGVWYILQSSNGVVNTYLLGASGNIPVPSAYIRGSSAPKNQSKDIPRDGLASLSYDLTSNRITTAGFTYDFAGNQTRKMLENGTALRFQYDAAGRLGKVKNDSLQTLVTYTYGASRERLITQEGDENSTNRTYYAWGADSVVSEYTEDAGNILVWAKNFIYMGGALLAIHNKTVSGESVQFNHSDQLGTRVVTNAGDGTSFEQNSLPFGTALDSESSGSISRRFTSYDRSASTNLDYAVNRFYDSSQGRFTTVDPIKMNAANLMNPQTLNLYAYTANDPVNRTDPDGQFWGIFGAIGSFLFGGGTTFNFNFNINGFRFGFGFQGHFKNVYVGVAGFSVQVTGENSIFNQFKRAGFTGNSTSSTCNLYISIRNNNNLTEEQIGVMQNEISRIFSQMGITTSFVKKDADFWLSVEAVGTRPLVVGSTPFDEKTGEVFNRGKVFIDKLLESINTSPVYRTLFKYLDPDTLTAIGLARAAAHEIGHYLLQQSTDGPEFTGVMKQSFSGGEWINKYDRHKWTFDPFQRLSIRSRICPQEERRGKTNGEADF